MQITLFHFEDELRENATAVVRILKEQCGLRLLMLTGDNATTAERVAKTVGIDEFHAGLKPDDKLSQVQRLRQEKGKSEHYRLHFFIIVIRHSKFNLMKSNFFM